MHVGPANIQAREMLTASFQKSLSGLLRTIWANPFGTFGVIMPGAKRPSENWHPTNTHIRMLAVRWPQTIGNLQTFILFRPYNISVTGRQKYPRNNKLLKKGLRIFPGDAQREIGFHQWII